MGDVVVGKAPDTAHTPVSELQTGIVELTVREGECIPFNTQQRAEFGGIEEGSSPTIPFQGEKFPFYGAIRQAGFPGKVKHSGGGTTDHRVSVEHQMLHLARQKAGSAFIACFDIGHDMTPPVQVKGFK